MGTLPFHHPEYRTKLCCHFASGSCPFGPSCSLVHVAARISPPSLPLAQHLFHWNAFLPQLLAVSNQQAALKQTMMPPRQSSPPRPKDPQFVGEDPSPSTSLLLSTSDCASLEQVRQHKRQPSKRKKYPCRHFVRSGGWCPAGTQCQFQHDVAALPSGGVRKAEYAPPFSDMDVYGVPERSISGGVLMGIQQPSPPIIRQEHPAPPRYLEAELAQHPHQPFHLPDYAWQPYQPYYPATTTVVPMPTTVARSSVVQHNLYPPVQHQAQSIPPPETETRTRLPMGAYEVNGTTYFPTAIPPVPAPAPVPYPIPVPPVPCNHMPVPPAYPELYARRVLPALPSSYCDMMLYQYQQQQQTTDVGCPQMSFDPFASDPMAFSELPVIPRLEDYQLSPPVQHGFVPLVSSSPNGVLTSMMKVPEDMAKPTMASEYEFPYQPPRNQRVGHVRRISVNVKKEGQACTNSG